MKERTSWRVEPTTQIKPDDMIVLILVIRSVYIAASVPTN